MVDYREILRLKSLGNNITQVAHAVHSSRNTVRVVEKLADEKGIKIIPDSSSWTQIPSKSFVFRIIMRLSKESLHASESYGGSSSSWKTQAI